MYKYSFLFTFIIFSLASTSSFSQTTNEKFIRIVGNAKGVYQAEGLLLYMTITEVQPNEYRQVRYKPLEAVNQTVVANLAKIGLKESDLLKDVRTPNSQFQAYKSDKLMVRIMDAVKAAEFMKMEMEGVSFTETKFIFKNPGAEAEEQLAVEAIKDAERKAQKIAKEIGKKVGKILSIDDKSSGCCREIEDAREKSVSKLYKINVTFELLD